MVKDIIRSNYSGYDLLHINDHFYQTIECCELLLNNNSINLLDKQDTNKISQGLFIYDGHIKLQTFRNWIYNNLTLIDINKLCLTGGILLYAYGIRKLGDIDGFMINYGMTETNTEISELIHINFEEDKTKFPFVDIAVEGSIYWDKTWSDKNNKIIKKFQISNLSEICLNPRYHMYFQGCKLYLLKFEIVRKLFRHNPLDYADFIMMYFFNRTLLDYYVYIDKDKLTFYPKYEITENRESPKLIENILNEIHKKYINLENKQINPQIIKSLLF